MKKSGGKVRDGAKNLGISGSKANATIAKSASAKGGKIKSSCK